MIDTIYFLYFCVSNVCYELLVIIESIIKKYHYNDEFYSSKQIRLKNNIKSNIINMKKLMMNLILGNKIHNPKKKCYRYNNLRKLRRKHSNSTFKAIINDVIDLKFGMKTLTTQLDHCNCDCQWCQFYSTPEQAQWPELKEKPYLYGKYMIEHLRPDLNIEMVKENQSLIANYKDDRVRIIVDKNEIIQTIPRIG